MNGRHAHRRWRAIVGALAAVTLIGPAGCGGDDDADAEPAEPTTAEADAADADADDGDGDDGSGADGSGAGENGGGGDTAADGAEGDAAGESDGTADIGDFPIPAPDGLLLDALADAGIVSEGQRQLFYPNDDVDRIVAFYDDWTGQNGSWARTEAEGTVIFQSLDTESIRTITITPDQEPGAQADGPVTFVILVAGE